MNATAPNTLPPYLVAELAMHLRNSGSELNVMQAASAAIRAWVKADKARLQAPAPAEAAAVSAAASAAGPSRGYLWKNLFLPHGTELRMSTRESTYHARVEGDDILFNGRSVSPRGMTLAIYGEGRNAWRDLWLKLPGERYWKPASRCRREQEQNQTQEQQGQSQSQSQLVSAVNPAQSLAAATVTMSDALRTMLSLMERVSARAIPEEDRRVKPARREADVFADHCALD